MKQHKNKNKNKNKKQKKNQPPDFVLGFKKEIYGNIIQMYGLISINEKNFERRFFLDSLVVSTNYFFKRGLFDRIVWGSYPK